MRPQMTRVRMIALYAILAICAITVIGSLIAGKSPPEAVYGLLGTFGAYVILGQDGSHHGPDGGGEPPIEPPPRRRARRQLPADSDDGSTP